MTLKRVFCSVLLVALLLLAALPAAQARRLCAEALTRCSTACNQQFGGSWFFGSFMTQGCVEGCTIGYLWCASSN
jgi:hypothetical protein